MATVVDSLSHLERTAAEPRDDNLHKIRIHQIVQVNSKIRLFQLQPLPSRTPLKFLPGQWLDVYVPGVHKAGGFTITSTPSMLRGITPHLELAIQKSPQNPPAAWLWDEPSNILGQELLVRVGGSFVWPPSTSQKPKRVIFVAGGVGINPLISMVGFLTEFKARTGKLGFNVTFLYSSRVPESRESEDILFLERLQGYIKELGEEGTLKVFLTHGPASIDATNSNDKTFNTASRRINQENFDEALGPASERNETICYICGVPTMTDEFVEKAKRTEGMLESNVFFEKWW